MLSGPEGPLLPSSWSSCWPNVRTARLKVIQAGILEDNAENTWTITRRAPGGPQAWVPGLRWLLALAVDVRRLDKALTAQHPRLVLNFALLSLPSSQEPAGPEYSRSRGIVWVVSRWVDLL